MPTEEHVRRLTGVELGPDALLFWAEKGQDDMSARICTLSGSEQLFRLHE